MRVLIGIKRHFRTRAAEWVMAAGMLWEGGYMLGPQDTLGSTHAYAFLRALAGDAFWGGWEAGIGAVWIGALILNGTFLRFRRISPWVRAVMSGSAATYLTLFAAGMRIGNPIGTGFINHATMAGMALVLCIFTAAEVHDVDEEAKRCRRRRRKP